jgi:uroporphyrinogen decarboxylase
LFATPDVIEAEVGRIKREAASIPGHIFNLGHGILPTTPIASVETLIRAVHAGGVG